jgi:hypothetical protein
VPAAAHLPFLNERRLKMWHTARPCIVIDSTSADIEKLPLELEPFKPRYNIAPTVTDHQGKGIVDITPCPDLRDRQRSILRINSKPLLATRESLISL